MLLRMCCLFIWLSTGVFGYDIEWNGKVYDDETVAQMITVITTTNPIPSIPSVKHIYPAQVALFQIPAFARCKKIIVFDGLQPGGNIDGTITISTNGMSLRSVRTIRILPIRNSFFASSGSICRGRSARRCGM